MNKAVFLDRDGTINVDKGYLCKKDDFELLPGVVEGLQKLEKTGYLLIIVTNQSGIARGFYTEEDFKELNDYMISMLKQQGVNITDVFYCPHLPDAKVKKYRMKCKCRKPKLGMYFEAMKKWRIDLSKSWAIGDKERDCAICLETECRGIIISKKDKKITNTYSRLYTADSLKAASDMILKGE